MSSFPIPTNRPENPLHHASFLSRLFFSWAYPLLKTGLQRPLQEEDLPHVDPIDSSKQGLALFQQFLADISHSSPSSRAVVQYAILKYYLRTLRWTQVKLALYIAAMVFQATALGQFLNYFSSSSSSHVYQGCLWATLLILCAAIIIFSTHSLYFDVWQMGMRLRIASVAAIFDKTLKLMGHGTLQVGSHGIHTSLNTLPHSKNIITQTATTSPSTMGQIVNLASNDSERFIMASVFGLYLLWGPIHAILVFVVGSILLRSILPFLIGYIFLFLFAAVQFIMSQRFVQYRGSIASITDHRVHWISQLLLGIRVLKMHAWEDAMSRRLETIRSMEVAGIQRAARLRAMNEAIFFASSITICLIIFVAHHALGGKLTLGTMYSIFALMNALQFTMVKYFSIAVMVRTLYPLVSSSPSVLSMNLSLNNDLLFEHMIKSCAECWVSVRRIVNFLSFPEMPLISSYASSSSKMTHENGTKDISIVSFRDVTCYWNHDFSSTSSDATTLSTLVDPSMILLDESAQGDDEAITSTSIVALYSINLVICRGELCCIIVS